jgi:nicotinamide phosphoribosyltransferase
MKSVLDPMLAIDFYKADHRRQYPEDTELVYSNFTPRSSRVDGVNHMVFFGLQYFLLEYLTRWFNESFFDQSQIEFEESLEYHQNLMETSLGMKFSVGHIRELYDLGYLPLHIKALPEGTRVPMGTPAMVMWNTDKRFYWLVNYMETLFSSQIWQPCTSATTADLFKQRFVEFGEATGADPALVDTQGIDLPSLVDIQGHDFSFRGMAGVEAAALSGAAHLLSFRGTDTVPAIVALDKYYHDENNSFIGGSVPATEHSVMSAGGMDNELGTLDRLLDLYPTGVLSVVSDTWDLFKLVSEYLPQLKDKILARDGLLVVRPDSGVPNLILNGDPHSKCELERKGVVHLLDDTFGHTLNTKGFKVLNRVGTIYGDGIDRMMQFKILNGLQMNGYVSTTAVLGLGSFTYQYVTRDTFGTVCKATYCEIKGEGTPIFKSPKTGGWKKSHKGLLRVNDDLTCTQDVSWGQEGGLLETVFRNGELTKHQSYAEIRQRLLDTAA